METRQEIYRRYFREFDSLRKIARDLQMSRKTVKRHLMQYRQAATAKQGECETSTLQEFLVSPPVYDSSKRVRRKLTMEVAELINQQLEENQRKRQEGLRKQIKRKIDIHENLLLHGHRIGYTTVCNYIRAKALHQQEAYIKQQYIAAEECEFDWAEVKLNIAGGRRRLYMAVFTSAFSNYRYSRLFSRQDTLAFMEAHNEFFAHIGGVYQEMVYDNMRVAVQEFVGRSEKTPTDALVNLAGWFHFRWRFCNVRRGNEKGHVERSVEYVRRKAFCNTDSFDSIEHASRHLLARCEQLNQLPAVGGKIPQEGLQQEHSSLWKYPGPMDCFLTQALRVDKYSTFCLGTNHYSVPDYLVNHMVDVKAYSQELKVYLSHQLICRHTRSYEKHSWTISIDHYLQTLSRKPGALHGSLALTQAPQPVREVYNKWFINNPRDFILLLQFCQTNQVEHRKLLETAIYVSGLCNGNVTAEKVIAILGNQPAFSQCPSGDGTMGEIEDFSNRQLEEINLLMALTMEEVI